jgi:DNA-binding transcriptional MerR regulator
MVRLIHQGKRFGFTLNEIGKVLALFAVPDELTGRTRFQPGEHACVAEILRIGAKKLEDLDKQMDSLRCKRRKLAVALNELRTPNKPGRKRTLPRHAG